MGGNETGHLLHRIQTGDVHHASGLREASHTSIEEGRGEDLGYRGDLTPAAEFPK